MPEEIINYYNYDFITPDMYGLMIVLSIICFIIAVIPMWRIFKRAGEGGWKSLIPIYNTYIIFKISTENRSSFWTFVISILAGSVLFVIPNVFTILLGLALLIVATVIEFIVYYRLARSFKYGAGMTIGLILLPLIFQYILAFSSEKKHKYVGPVGPAK